MVGLTPVVVAVRGVWFRRLGMPYLLEFGLLRLVQVGGVAADREARHSF